MGNQRCLTCVRRSVTLLFHSSPSTTVGNPEAQVFNARFLPLLQILFSLPTNKAPWLLGLWQHKPPTSALKICKSNIQIYSQGKAAALRAQLSGCALLHIREATRLSWHLQGTNKFWVRKQTPTNYPSWVKLTDVKPNPILFTPAECQQETDSILGWSQDTIFFMFIQFQKNYILPLKQFVLSIFQKSK